jgi:hypothetical protein
LFFPAESGVLVPCRVRKIGARKLIVEVITSKITNQTIELKMKHFKRSVLEIHIKKNIQYRLRKLTYIWSCGIRYIANVNKTGIY